MSETTVDAREGRLRAELAETRTAMVAFQASARAMRRDRDRLSAGLRGMARRCVGIRRDARDSLSMRRAAEFAASYQAATIAHLRGDRDQLQAELSTLRAERDRYSAGLRGMAARLTRERRESRNERARGDGWAQRCRISEELSDRRRAVIERLLLESVGAEQRARAGRAAGADGPSLFEVDSALLELLREAMGMWGPRVVAQTAAKLAAPDPRPGPSPRDRSVHLDEATGLPVTMLEPTTFDDDIPDEAFIADPRPDLFIDKAIRRTRKAPTTHPPTEACVHCASPARLASVDPVVDCAREECPFVSSSVRCGHDRRHGFDDGACVDDVLTSPKPVENIDVEED